jgi:hypothetical protein
MLARMMGAARLNVATFEDVESDKGATIQALIVVILVSIAGGIGGILTSGIMGLVFGILGGLFQWALWALVTFLIGTTILKTPETQADWAQLARTTGFAQTPGLFKVLGFLPVVGPIIVFIASIWQLAAMVTAVRQALDYHSTWRAVGVVVIGFLIVVIPLGIVGMMIAGATGAANGG